MPQTKSVSVEAAVHWHSLDARHTDRQLFQALDLQRDRLPGDLGTQLAGAEAGEICRTGFSADDTKLQREDQLVRTIRPEQFKTRPRPALVVTPRAGRFYPRNFISGEDPGFEHDRRPCRCLAVHEDALRFDFNPPFAGYGGEMSARLLREPGAAPQQDAAPRDVFMELAGNGPGMQARLAQQETDFFYEGAFDRMDPGDDAQFYKQPRLVQHIDSTAIGHIREIYSRFIEPDMKVLDLMSSWVSHLPEPAGEVTGLGMNEAELKQNSRLQHWMVHDLNRDSSIPQPQSHFDAAVCTVSVEYLIDPVQVFRSVAQVLKPGAPFIITFSDRWFPSKAIQVWEELHPFERMGLVLAYFRNSQGFDGLATESVQNWPRPKDDKYAERMVYSDPVFAVWGFRRDQLHHH